MQNCQKDWESSSKEKEFLLPTGSTYLYTLLVFLSSNMCYSSDCLYIFFLLFLLFYFTFIIFFHFYDYYRAFISEPLYISVCTVQLGALLETCCSWRSSSLQDLVSRHLSLSWIPHPEVIVTASDLSPFS